MAKGKTDAYEQFLADLKEVVGDNWNQVEESLLKNEKASAKLKDGVLARSEMSRQLDALRDERKSFEAEVTEARTRIDGWKKWYGDVSTELATYQEKVNTYESQYGPLSDGDKRQLAREAGLSREEIQKVLQDEIGRRDLAALKFADDLTEIKMDYRERFKEKLPTESVYKIAGEKGLPLDAAYNIFIADKVEAQRVEKYEADLKAAREEGAREALSKHNLPVVSSTSDYVHVLDAKNVPTNSRDRINAAIDSFVNKR